MISVVYLDQSIGPGSGGPGREIWQYRTHFEDGLGLRPQEDWRSARGWRTRDEAAAAAVEMWGDHPVHDGPRNPVVGGYTVGEPPGWTAGPPNPLDPTSDLRMARRRQAENRKRG